MNISFTYVTRPYSNQSVLFAHDDSTKSVKFTLTLRHFRPPKSTVDHKFRKYIIILDPYRFDDCIIRSQCIQ